MEKITKKRMYLETGKSSKILLAFCKKPAPTGEAYILKGSSDLVLCPGVGPAILCSLSAGIGGLKPLIIWTDRVHNRPKISSYYMDPWQLVNNIIFPAREYNLFHFIVQEESHQSYPIFSVVTAVSSISMTNPNRYLFDTWENYSFCLDGGRHICYKTARLW